jgi:hypothetical protein
MDRDSVALNPDIITADITQAEKTAGYYTPVFKIRITHEGLHSNRYKGMVIFDVFSFNDGEIFTKKYYLLVTKAADTEVNNIKLIDFKYREQLISAFVELVDDYATVYVQSGSSTYNNPIFIQFIMAPYRPFIEELPYRNANILKANLTGTIFEPIVVNKPSLTWTNGWNPSIDAIYTSKNTEIVIDFDRVSLSAAVFGGTMTNGTKIGAVSPIPHFKPRKIIAHTIDINGVIAHCWISLEVNGDLLIYSATTNNLVMFDLDYSVYY